jgi:hypothetical protein
LDDFRGDCKPSGDQINFKYCPVCGHDGWKAYVNPLTGGWFCFAGIHNQGGKVEVGLPGDTAGQYLLDLLHAQPLGIPEWSETDLPPWEPLSKSALRYLASRQIDEAAARRYGLVEWTDHYRIVFPYFSNAGDMIFWTSRRYSKAVGYGPKYLAGPGPKPLYMRHVNSGHLVLVEGVFDALSVERAGFAAAALGGKSLPRYLVTFLLTNAERYGIINVMLDADALAKSLGIRSQLMSKRVVKICAYPPGQDPAQMGPDRIQELII